MLRFVLVTAATCGLLVTSFTASPQVAHGIDAAGAPQTVVVERALELGGGARSSLAADQLAGSPDSAGVAAPDGPVTAGATTDDGHVVTPEIPSGGAQTVGVTWPQGLDASAMEVQIRQRTADGWSSWSDLAVDDAEPDAGTPDATSSRDGTDALWIGDSDAIQLSFGPDAATVGGMELALVSSMLTSATASAAPAVARGGSQAVALPAALAAAPSAPSMITRGQWGAAPAVCTLDTASRLVGAVVHHTAGSNSYSTVAQAMQQIRNDQAYHINSRGWCDLGYNFVVDKWGNLYEGRAGSLTSPVIGVHAGGFNTGTVGVAMLGTYSDAAPSLATLGTVAQVIGFRLAAYGVDPTGSMQYTTGAGENSRYHNQTVTLPRVMGHRDVAYTECPGNAAYPLMPQIRQMAARQLDAQAFTQARAVVTALYVDLLGRGPDPTGLSGWSAALLSGVSQSALVSSLTASDEYISLRVRQAYQQVLGRDPDPTGAAGWLAVVRARQLSVDDAARRLYDSDEFYASTGGTWDGYVQRLYQTVLGRSASAGEVVSWTAMAQRYGRSWLVNSIWWSQEAASMRAGGYYQTFLGRGPDPSGQVAWAQVLLSSGEGAVRAGIAGSQEYAQRALTRYPTA